jgi:hypothetical protein
MADDDAQRLRDYERALAGLQGLDAGSVVAELNSHIAAMNRSVLVDACVRLQDALRFPFKEACHEWRRSYDRATTLFGTALAVARVYEALTRALRAWVDDAAVETLCTSLMVALLDCEAPQAREIGVKRALEAGAFGLLLSALRQRSMGLHGEQHASMGASHAASACRALSLLSQSTGRWSRSAGLSYTSPLQSDVGDLIYALPPDVEAVLVQTVRQHHYRDASYCSDVGAGPVHDALCVLHNLCCLGDEAARRRRIDNAARAGIFKLLLQVMEYVASKDADVDSWHDIRLNTMNVALECFGLFNGQLQLLQAAAPDFLAVLLSAMSTRVRIVEDFGFVTSACALLGTFFAQSAWVAALAVQKSAVPVFLELLLCNGEEDTVEHLIFAIRNLLLCGVVQQNDFAGLQRVRKAGPLLRVVKDAQSKHAGPLWGADDVLDMLKASQVCMCSWRAPLHSDAL